MTTADGSGQDPVHPWRTIDLEVYEQHMADAQVGQLQELHAITGQQLAAHPARALAVLGVAGGNGLDLVDPASTDVVLGYDVNADYLAACEVRYRPTLGARLRLVEATVDRHLVLEPVDLVIANLVVEYVGLEEFGAFAAANAGSIGVLSCVVQHGGPAEFVSSTRYASSFDALSSLACDVSAEALDVVLTHAGFEALHRVDHPLPNGKTLVRQDFRPAVTGRA